MENEAAVVVQDRQFSYYENPITNTKPKEKPLTISRIHKGITSEVFKEATEQIRSESDKTKRNILKGQLLHYVTFSGIFTKRADSALKQHSGLICIDIDHIGDDLELIKNQVKLIYTPALIFRSPSGDGLKVVYQVDISQAGHLDYFQAFQNHFKWEYDIDIDTAGKDISRACYLCHDDEAFTTKFPDLLGRGFIDTYTHGNNIIEAGREFLQRSGAAFIEGERNNYVMRLAAYCHRRGMPVEDVVAELINYAEPGFPVKEIETTIQSIYKNESYAGVEVCDKKSPRPKTKETEPVLPFPVELLPGFIGDMVKKCHAVYGTPSDFWAGAFLAAMSTAIGNSVILHDGKYCNNPALWFAFVGPTGIGKTEPLSFALNPFHLIDDKAHQAYRDQKQLFDECRNKTTKERGGEVPPEKPVLHQYLLTDFTPEALAQVHTENPRGIIVHRDELMGWINDFNRYNKSGEVQNWLSIWSGMPVTYNRRTQEPIKIIHPCVSISGGIQPGLLKAMGANHRTENGLMQRFCFFYPDHMVKPYYSRQQLLPEYGDNYNRFIQTLLSIPMDEDQYITLGNDARELYKDFVNANTDLINNEKSDYMKGVYSKLEIISLRLALIHQIGTAVIIGDDVNQVEAASMHFGIRVSEYFRVTGRKVYSHFTTGGGLTNSSVAEYLYHEVGIKNQSEIARILGVSQPYINKVLNRE